MRIITFFKKSIKILLDMLLPARCMLCGAIIDSSGALCADCFSKIHFIASPICEICGLPLELEENEKQMCARCIHKTPRFKRARAAMVYNDNSKNIVLGFKHADRTESAPVFARWLVRAGEDLLTDADIIIPVPLHYTRLFSRRYNQAALLAKEIAKELNGNNIKVCYNALTRNRRTASQGRFSKSERYKNVSGAFTVKNPKII
ncbi:MAG: ComF family protein, partial [Alphaproteobacteria bacterium]|nr:ComF family protein [Alphaproteobacteria bacterium]